MQQGKLTALEVTIMEFFERLFAVENNLWFLLPTSWNGTYLSQV
jgi:hypothetical protein